MGGVREHILTLTREIDEIIDNYRNGAPDEADTDLTHIYEKSGEIRDLLNLDGDDDSPASEI
jgi:hypothetical protein